MADDLKIRVQVESKAAEAALDRTAAKVANVKTSASTGSSAWTAYTGAMRAATGAVRGFFSALGIVGAVMGGINMVISLWKTLSETIRGPAVRAAEEAKKAAEDLKKAQEEAARAAQERFENATNAAREYIQTLKEAAALEQAKLSDRSRIRSANTAAANADIDRQIATGETSKTHGDAQKRMNSLLARQAELEDARRTAKQALDDARAARDAKARDLQEAVAEEQRTGAASREADAATAAFAKNHAAGRAGVGLIAAAQEERTRRDLETKAAEAAARHDEASATVDSRQAFLDAAEDHLAEVVSKTARNLEIYDAELAANAAEIAAAEAEFEARASKERASTLDTVGKDAAAEANKELDRQASAGSISQAQAAAQQVVNSLQAQLDALVKARDEGAEIAGVQWDSAWIEKALADVQGKLAEAVAKAAVADGIKHDSPKVSSSMVAAGSDPWARIGAFAGNGVQSEAVNLQRSSLTALKALQSYAARIAERMNRNAATPTL